MLQLHFAMIVASIPYNELKVETPIGVWTNASISPPPPHPVMSGKPNHPVSISPPPPSMITVDQWKQLMQKLNFVPIDTVF